MSCCCCVIAPLGVLLALVCAQAAVGTTQYFTGVPAALVAIHLALAATVWAVTVRFYLSLTVQPGEIAAAPTPPGRRLPTRDSVLT